jgi:acyl carrier protein
MDRADLLKEIERIVELDDGILRGEETLKDLGDWDSLAIMSFIAMVDKKFSILIEGAKIIECKTVNDLIYLVQERTS